MEEITKDELKHLCKDKTIRITQYSLNRLRERKIKYNDIKACIEKDEIIEQYPSDYPYPSCLMLKTSSNA